MQPWRSPLWPHDANHQASGKSGAVHTRSVLGYTRVITLDEARNMVIRPAPTQRQEFAQRSQRCHRVATSLT